MELETPRLTLRLESPAELLQRIEGMSSADQSQISPDWLARLRSLTVADPWTCGFLITHRDTGAAVGNCGFKGPPSAGGIVEIAYSVYPDYRGRGFATEAALGLVACAWADDRVRLVCAHTLPEPNASTRVLAKCGFRRSGEVVDPEEGLVWRWELARSVA